MLLRDVAYVRSGDKGDVVSIGVIAALFGEWLKGEARVYRMDNIEAVVVVMQHALGGGATRTLRLDQTAKALGNAILRLPARER